MNVQEGARRIRHAGRWLVLIPSTIVILSWAAAMAASGLHPGFGIFLGPEIIFAVFALYLGIGGGVLWLAGWIVEGFAKHPG